MEACLGHRKHLVAHCGSERYARHQARHGDEGVDSTEADTDAPESRSPYNALTERLVTSHEAQHSARAVRKALVDLTSWMVFQPGVEDFESQVIEVVGDTDG